MGIAPGVDAGGDAGSGVGVGGVTVGVGVQVIVAVTVTVLAGAVTVISAVAVTVVSTVTVAAGAAGAADSVTVGPVVTVVVADGVAVTVLVGHGSTFMVTAGLPLVLYDPLPSFFDALPAPVVTGSSALVVLQDLPLHTFCFTVKRAAPPYLTETCR